MRLLLSTAAFAGGLGLAIGGMFLQAQNRPPAPTMAAPSIPTVWADVQIGPNLTAVIVRDPKGANQMIVTTFYWQKLTTVEKPILRSITEVVPVVKDVAVGANGAPDPASVNAVHISLIKIVDRMEWTPPPASASKP